MREINFEPWEYESGLKKHTYISIKCNGKNSVGLQIVWFCLANDCFLNMNLNFFFSK